MRRSLPPALLHRQDAAAGCFPCYSTLQAGISNDPPQLRFVVTFITRHFHAQIEQKRVEYDVASDELGDDAPAHLKTRAAHKFSKANGRRVTSGSLS